TMSGSVRHILYSSKAGGYAVDTIPFPANGCSDPYTKVCLTDSQLRSEINRVIGDKSWTRGPSSVFFMFTPRNVGSCFGGRCAFTQFCAYHSWSGSGATVTLYANMPYAAYVPSACGSGHSP